MTEEQAVASSAPGARRTAARILAPLAAIVLLVTLVTGYANRVLFDSDRFADHVVAALEEEPVRDEVAQKITGEVVLRAKRDLIALEPVIEGAAGEIVGSKAFQSLIRSAVSDLHRSIFKKERDTVALTLVDVGTVLQSALQAVAPKVAKDIGADKIDLVNAEPPQALVTAARIADDVGEASLILIIVSILLIVAAVAISPERRRTLVVFSASVAIGAAVLVVVWLVGRRILKGSLDPDVSAAAGGIYDAFLGDLVTLLLITAAGGVILAAALTRPLRPDAVEGPVRRAWRIATTVPEGTIARAGRALGLIALGILIIAERDLALELVALAAGLFVLYKGVEEGLELIAPPSPEAAGRVAGDTRRPLGRLLLLGGGAAIALVIVGGVIVSGEVGAPAAEADGCNGSEELCERTLDEVAIPATHNAMSAANQPDYLFPQQDEPIPKQLEEGVRGLLIDAHYGVRTSSGVVKTDLSDIPEGERDTYAGSLGEEGLDAALRIRDRIAGSGEGNGERKIYLCHRFCELGAIDAEKTLEQIREFMVLHPNTVIVISVEDYVAAKDFMKIVDSSGLGELVYRGPVEPGVSPTLGELIEQNKRVVLMAEMHGGTIEGYRDAYGGLLRETPFSFKKVDELNKPGKQAASCEANRGDEDSPLFLLNHWIDSSPAAKPSNAEKVNAAEPLLARIQRCASERDGTVNVIAVDFYATGDVIDVAKELNAGG